MRILAALFRSQPPIPSIEGYRRDNLGVFTRSFGFRKARQARVVKVDATVTGFRILSTNADFDCNDAASACVFARKRSTHFASRELSGIRRASSGRILAAC